MPETLDQAYDRLLVARDEHWDAWEDCHRAVFDHPAGHPARAAAETRLRVAARRAQEAEADWQELLAPPRR